MSAIDGKLMFAVSTLAARRFRRILMVGPMAIMACCAQQPAQEPDSPYVHSIATTYHDLQAVKKRAAFNQIQQKYYDAALAQLKKTVDRTQHGGNVEKPALEEIIQDVQFVIDHDPIQETGRLHLTRDIAQMRILRDQL